MLPYWLSPSISPLFRLYVQEKRREEEEAEAQINIHLVQEAAHAKLAKDLNNEVWDF